MQADTFDYIVVGSGPAGCVMAKALSDNGTTSVLLLEAGANDDNDPLIQDPNANLYAHFPTYFWPGQSLPQKNVMGKDFPLTGGRTAGGGSSVNGEMYVRPTPFVLDQWARLAGPQWAPEKATEAFKELEKYLGTSDDPEIHGTEGSLNIRQNYPDAPALLDKITAAFEKATGHPTIQDYNNPRTPIGPFKSWQLYQKPDGKRASASVSFLQQAAAEAAMGKRNLELRFKSTVTKVLFDEEKRATGVSYIERGVTKEAQATKKVIVCAGIHSTKLLMLSGIGPKSVLDDAGIEAVVINPYVGRNQTNDTYVSALLTVNPSDIEELAHKDPHAKVHGGAFFPAPDSTGEARERSIQVIVTGATPQALHVSILCVNPYSRGTFEIQDDDPLTMMLGDFKFFADERDMDTLMAALRTYIEPMAREFSAIDPAYQLIAPTAEVLADDDKLRTYILESFGHTYHDQCSLRMGGEADAVVNGWGEVHGVKDLIVADASIIPYHMDGNTSACSYFIGHTIAKHLIETDE